MVPSPKPLSLPFLTWRCLAPHPRESPFLVKFSLSGLLTRGTQTRTEFSRTALRAVRLSTSYQRCSKEGRLINGTQRDVVQGVRALRATFPCDA